MLVIDSGWPPAYAKAARLNGPLRVPHFSNGGTGGGVSYASIALRSFGLRGSRTSSVVSLDDALRDPQGESDGLARDRRARLKSYCVLAPAKLCRCVDEIQS